MTLDLSLLPWELQRLILAFVDDLAIRMHFRVYRRVVAPPAVSTTVRSACRRAHDCGWDVYSWERRSCVPRPWLGCNDDWVELRLRGTERRVDVYTLQATGWRYRSIRSHFT